MEHHPGLVVAGLLAVLGLGFIPPCQAQGNRVPEAQIEAPRWRITFTPHLWASGLTGNVGVGGLITEVSLSFSDIMDQMDIGVMGLLEARRNPWVLRADVFFVNLGDEADPITVSQEQLMLQPEVGRTIANEP